MAHIVNNSMEVSDEVFREWVTSWRLWSLQLPNINPSNLFVGMLKEKGER
jgi:hypothetical protein